jgi:hypothetical protein
MTADLAALQKIILGGAQRVRPRVRGFAAWSPRADTLRLLDLVRAVLDEYAEYLPLTLRQIFYRLVGAHNYPKTEQAYERLGEHLVRARRARIIPMHMIRDDGGTIIRPTAWASVEEFIAVVQHDAEQFRLDRTDGQETRLAVLCEAVGMAPQLARVTDPYGITVMSSGGFDSLTEKYQFARELADEDRPVEVVSVGDHDGSGAHMYLAYIEDILAFTRELGGEVSFTRLAVTPEQIAQYGLPTAPPKPTDKRAFSGETCQAEALAPDVLADILRAAIDVRIDRTALERVHIREREARRQLDLRFAGGD